MPNALDVSKRAQLVKFGFSIRGSRDYGVILENFDEHWVKLLSHTGRTDQMPSFSMRIGNPAQIDNAEADYLLRKMLNGYYPWPVEECLEHEFENEERKVNGCRWCRDRQNKHLGSPGDAVEAAPVDLPGGDSEIPESPESAATAPPLVAFEDVVCVDCGWIAEAETKSGKSRSKNQRTHALSMHRRSHSQKGVPATAGATKE